MTTKMEQTFRFNMGQKNDCGCQVMTDRAQVDYFVKHCTLHADAPGLLRALKAAITILGKLDWSPYPQISKEAWVKGHEAIDAAEGR